METKMDFTTKKGVIKRLLTMALGLIMAVTAYFTVLPGTEMTVKAAGTGKNLQIGSAVLMPEMSDSNELYDWALRTRVTTAQTVYYGSNGTQKWLVIGYNGTGAVSIANTATLFAIDNMETGKEYRAVGTSNSYVDSDIRKILIGESGENGEGGYYSSKFNDVERGAILGRTLSQGGYGNPISPTYIFSDGIYDSSNPVDKLWLLSTKEADLLKRDYRRASNDWWLRSPGIHAYNAALVNSDGYVNYAGILVDYDDGVRPAFNLNLQSIIFTSAAAGGKSSSGIGAAALTAPSAYYGSLGWKLTVLDSTRSFSASRADTAAVPPEDTLVIDYTGATVGTNEFISAILLGSTGELLYYGRVQSKASGNTDGSALVTIPAGLADGTYTLKVFSEQYNGDQLTDLASAFSTINFTVDATAPRTYTLPVPPTTPEPSNVTPASQGSPEETMDDTPETNYFDELTTKLEEAIKAGGQQTIYWNEGTALPGPVMKLLQENPQITLVFSYTYEGLDYVVTLPGKYVKYDPNVPWCGPLYLYGLYGRYGVSAPVSSTTLSGERTYTVISGETLWRIARRLGTTVDELVRLNHITNPDRINIGQIIRY